RHRRLTCLPLGDRQDDLQQSAFVYRGRACRVDLAAEVEPPLERAVLDLHRLVARARDRRTLPDAGDQERSAGRDDLDPFGLDAGQLDDDVQRGRVVRRVAVALRPEAATDAGEARHLPEVGEELLDLPLEIVEVPLAPAHRLPRTRSGLR